VVLVLLLSLSACTPATAYVEADRATFDAIAPAYLDYLRGDELLDESQVDRRSRLVDTWRIRIEQAEGK
jgi:hypothetical protein